VIQNRASPPEVYGSYFTAATRCQSHISTIAEKGSLSERYCLLLDELRAEALRQTERVHPPVSGRGRVGADSHEGELQPAPIAIEPNLGATTNFTEFVGDSTTNFNDVPGPVPSDHSGWDQFASMISSGLGNLDVFLNDDSFAL
jgi:hypothetical protein